MRILIPGARYASRKNRRQYLPILSIILIGFLNVGCIRPPVTTRVRPTTPRELPAAPPLYTLALPDGSRATFSLTEFLPPRHGTLRVGEGAYVQVRITSARPLYVGVDYRATDGTREIRTTFFGHNNGFFSCPDKEGLPLDKTYLLGSASSRGGYYPAPKDPGVPYLRLAISAQAVSYESCKNNRQENPTGTAATLIQMVELDWKRPVTTQPLLPTEPHLRIHMEFIQIVPGEFTMGCSPGDDDCLPAERPAHRVRVTKAFEIGKYEVTQAEWQDVMGWNPSSPQDWGANIPVHHVTWTQVQDFLQRLNSRQDGYRYRLPSEAEWEYAARATSTGPFPAPLKEIGWYRDNCDSLLAPFGRLHEVGKKTPNSWGMFDTHGNVAEWVEDGFDAFAYSKRYALSYDPITPTAGDSHVVRGGNCWSEAREARVSMRSPASEDTQTIVGFRYIRERV